MPMFAPFAAADVGVDVKQGAAYAVVLLLGSGIQWFLQWVVSVRSRKRSDYLADESLAVSEYKNMLESEKEARAADRTDFEARLRKKDEQIDRLTQRMDVEREETVRLRLTAERAIAWIRHVHDLFEGLQPKHRLPFRLPRWSETTTGDTSTTHTPLADQADAAEDAP